MKISVKNGNFLVLETIKSDYIWILFMNSKKVMLLLIFLVVVTSCSNQNTVIIHNEIEKFRIKVEVANDFEEISKGLMFREFLDENNGMLFVFGNEDYHSFWMKNTLIPLDLIFISDEFEIVDIIYAEPCNEYPCSIYRPVKPAKYVLEVNGNFTIKNNIKTGNKITIQ